MPSGFSDLNRPPLRQRDLERALLRQPGVWSSLRVVARTGSTNADLVRQAAEGAESGTVLVAESQSAGRGRLDRTWTAPARSGLTFSVLLRPRRVPANAWGWFPLLAGLAVARATTEVTELAARLKWPNDVLVGERKLAGILAERAGEALVLGIGLNVSLRDDELPTDAATSLEIEGSAVLDRPPVLLSMLRGLAEWYDVFEKAEGDADASGLRAAYVELCGTLGREVRVELPGGRTVTGTAGDIDPEGRLLVTGPEGDEAVGAGDVVHLR